MPMEDKKDVVKLLGKHHQGVWEEREEPECQ
jgi:hypothetical protein